MIIKFLIVFFVVTLDLFLFRSLLPNMISSDNDIMVWVGMVTTFFVTAGQVFVFYYYFALKR